MIKMKIFRNLFTKEKLVASSDIFAADVLALENLEDAGSNVSTVREKLSSFIIQLQQLRLNLEIT